MNGIKAQAVLAVVVLTMLAWGSVAHATPTDSGFPWSMNNLRVADIGPLGTNDVSVRFRDPNGAIRNYWHNSAGADICFGSDTLFLERARTNIKSVNVSMQ